MSKAIPACIAIIHPIEAQMTRASVVMLDNSTVAKRLEESLIKTIVRVMMYKIIINADERIKSKYEPAAQVFEYFVATLIKFRNYATI